MIILSEADVKASLSMSEAIRVNSEAFCAHHRSSTNVPERHCLSDVGGANNVSLFMPAHISGKKGSHGTLGLKVVSVRPGNDSLGLPTVPATVLIFDEQTGLPRGLVAATYLTALRTAAGSGAATDAMYRQTSDPLVLVLFGAGMQAGCHADAICAVRTVGEVFIINRSAPRAEALAERLKSEYGVAASVILQSDEPTVEQALAKADVICVATNSSTPLFDGDKLKSGCHINAVGSYTPEMQEIGEQVVARARVVTDTMSALEAGCLQHPMASGKLELGNIITLGALLNGEIGNWAEQPGCDITLFKSVGTAMQDVATGAAAIDAAEKQGLGFDTATATTAVVEPPAVPKGKGVYCVSVSVHGTDIFSNSSFS
jgi:ornithine cyclodeaminase